MRSDHQPGDEREEKGAGKRVRDTFKR